MERAVRAQPAWIRFRCAIASVSGRLHSLHPDLSINFAREATFLEYASDPSLLEAQLRLKKPETVFIDEVQRLPSILLRWQLNIYRFASAWSGAV